MATILLFSLAVALALSTLATILYSGTRLLQRYRGFAATHGCQPIHKVRHLDPILGLDHFIRIGKAAHKRRFLECWDKDHHGRYGPTFEINLMGEAVLSTCDPDNLRAILSTRFRDFQHGTRRRAITGIFLGEGLVNTDGEAWAHERALAKPSFARAHEFLGTFEKHFRVWLEALPVDKGNAVDWQKWAFRYTLDVSAELFFGKPVGVLRADATAQARGFEAAWDVALLGIQRRFKLGKLAWLYYHPGEASAIRVVQDQVDSMVRDALENKNSRPETTASETGSGDNDARQHCAQFLRALADEGLNLKQIREQMLSIVVAARDTSACLMSAVVFTLARQPDVQKKLRQEIQAYVGSRPPTVSRLEAMKYLSWVLKETLRLYPPLAINVRQAAQDTMLPRGGGLNGLAPVFVPEGQTVLLSAWSAQRRRDLWGHDADEFKPERWEGARPRWEYLPFSGGPRVCPGQRMAMVEAGYVIVRFMQEFEHIAAVDTDAPWRENLTLTCSIAQGVQVRMIRRE